MRHDTATEQGAAGQTLFVQRWRPDRDPRALIVLVHGLAEHSGRYDALARRLVGRDLAVYALDHAGHGRSTGPRAYVDRFDRWVVDVAARVAVARREHPGRRLALLGHSMGGAIALATALSHPDGIDALALSAPALGADPDVPRLRLALARVLAVLAPRVGALTLPADAVSRDPEVVRAYGADPLVYRGAIPARTLVELLGAMAAFPGRAPALAVPVLALHGTDDRLVPLRFVEPVYARLGSSDRTIVRYDGLYHEVFNEPERERVIGDLEQWLDARL